MSPLSNEQKAKIGAAARTAYLAWDGREGFEAINDGTSHTACMKAWRYVETGKVTGGIQSLRECTQAHYGRLLAHFQRLAGETARADSTMVRDADNSRRIARWKLGEALTERGLEIGYAAAICRSKYKCALDQATAAQLWKLVFDVRSRRKAAAKSAAREELDENCPF